MSRLKTFFRNAFGQPLRKSKQLLWLTISWSILVLVVLPLVSAFKLSEVSTSLYHWSTERICALVVDLTPYVIYGTLLVGMLTTNTFNYLNSSKELNFYHSQPISRKTLFRQNYIAGWISYFIPLTTAFLCEAGIIAILHDLSTETIIILLECYVFCLASYFSVNSMSMLAVMLCGNRLASFLTSIYLCVVPSTLLGAFWYYVDIFAVNFNYRHALMNTLVASTPLVYLIDLMEKSAIEEITIEYPLQLVVHTLISIGALLLSRWLYSKRKSEMAGRPFAYPKLVFLIRYPATICFAWVGGLLFNALTDFVLWTVFASVVFGALAFFAINGIEQMSFRGAFRGWVKLLLCGVGFISCIAAIFVGCTLVGGRTTKDENIISFDVYALEYDPNGYATSHAEYKLDDEILNITEKDAVKSLNVIANRGAKKAFSNKIVDRSQPHIWFSARINTMFGSYKRTFAFYVQPDDTEIIDAVNNFAFSTGVKQAYTEQLFAEIDADNELVSFSPDYYFHSVDITKQLYDALKKDMASAKPEDYAENPIGCINICYYVKDSIEGYNGDKKSTNVPIFPSFKNVIESAGESLVLFDFNGIGEFESDGWYSTAEFYVGAKKGYKKGYEQGKKDKLEGKDYSNTRFYDGDDRNEGYAYGFWEGYELGYYEAEE